MPLSRWRTWLDRPRRPARPARRHPKTPSRKLTLEMLEDRTLPSITLTGSPDWVEQGPGPINNGQVSADPNNAVTGAVQALVEHPTTAGMVFAGTVAGGVWRTADITGGGNPANVNWVPLSDTLESLYIGALAADPSNPNTLYVGTGSYSNTFRNQLPEMAIGLYRTTNDTAVTVTWENLGRSTFAGLAVRSIVVSRADADLLLVAAANADGTGGLFRSEDGGDTWTALSDGTILPFTGSATDVIADPNNANTFYAAAPGQGVFETDNDGDNWERIDDLNTAITGIDVSTNLRLAAHKNGAQTVLYVGVIDGNGQLSGVFRTTVSGAATTWQEIGSAPNITNGGQGFNNFSITADPGNANLVYVGGDQPPDIFRGDASADGGAGDWFQVSGNADVSNTGPHADSRSFLFLRSGVLLEFDDGGIYSLTNPQDPMDGTDSWTTLAGNLRDTELHGVAYDTARNLVFGGAQDNGVEIQATTNSLAWNHYQDGDGSTQAYSIPGDVRYSLGNNFGNFTRTNGGGSPTAMVLAAPATPNDSLSGLENTSGANNDQDFANSGNFESHLALEVNRFNAADVLFGRRALYESSNQGDTISIVIGPTDFGKSATDRFQSAAYGGTHFPGVFYAGTAGGRLFVRDETGTIHNVTAALSAVIPGTDTISDITLDPANYTRAFVVKGNRVAMTTDAGQHWQEITGNLASLTSAVRTIALVDPTPTVAGGGVVVVGGLGGVFRLLPGLAGTCDAGQMTWTEFGNGLPHTLVQDLDYVPVDPDGNAADGTGILLAGTFGRGAWTINNVTASIQVNGVLTVTGDAGDNAMALREDPSNESRIIVGDGLGNTRGFDKAQFERVDFQGLAGNDTVTVSSDGTTGPAATGDVDFVTFQLTVEGGGQAGDKLILEDRGGGSAARVTVTAGTVGQGAGDSFFGDCGRLNYSGLGNLTLDLTDHSDTVTVQGAGAGTALVVQCNGGDDRVNVSVTAASGYQMLVDGGPGTDVLAVTDVQGGAVIHDHKSGPASGTVQVCYLAGAMSVISYQSVEQVPTNSTPDQSYIQALYHQFLQRDATPQEIAAWEPALSMPGGQVFVANGIIRSREAYTVLVRSWYVHYLGRAAQNGEEQGWVNALLQGLTQEVVLSTFLNSLEYYQKAGGTDAGFIRKLFLDLLGRAPGNNEVFLWEQSLLMVGRGGVSWLVLESQEYRSKFVTNLYQTLFMRPATPAEAAAWALSPFDLTTLEVLVASSNENFANGC